MLGQNGRASLDQPEPRSLPAWGSARLAGLPGAALFPLRPTMTAAARCLLAHVARGLRKVMRVLVTWGSKCGGTEGIARIIAETLQRQGLEVQLLPAVQARHAGGFEAVIVAARCMRIAGWRRPAVRCASGERAAPRPRLVPLERSPG